MVDLALLKSDSEGFVLLYAEDNEALRTNATKLLKKIFHDVHSAIDGVQALQLAKECKPHILITDIKMPNMGGIALAKEIKKIAPQTLIIFMSAYDDKEYLHGAINVNAFAYLNKPVSLTDLAQTLKEAIDFINQKTQLSIFESYIKTIFNTQSFMVLMLKNDIPSIANQPLLDLFQVSDMEMFREKFSHFTNYLQPHEGFLHDTKEMSWYKEISLHPNKLYNMKLALPQGGIKHFVAKYQAIASHEGYAILSLDDITELNLLWMFDKQHPMQETKSTKALYELLEIIMRNNTKVELHNFYKGLSITNDATLMELTKNSITLQTKYIQQKAIQLEGKTLLVSEMLPLAIACNTIVLNSFEKQEVVLESPYFVETSAAMRSTIRVEPLPEHTATLFINGAKFNGDVRLLDISLDAARVRLDMLPAGISSDEEIILDLVLTLENRPFLLNTKVTLFKKIEKRDAFEVVLLFAFRTGQKSELIKYITKRQMSLIRELKGLQNG